MLTLSFLILAVAFVFALVELVRTQGRSLICWAVGLTDLYLLLGHGLTFS